MGLLETVRSRGAALAEQTLTKLLDDPKRAGQIGGLLGMLQRGRKALDEAQEAALKGLGVASRGDVQAAGKRLAALRRSARSLDEKLGAVAGRLDGGSSQ